MKATLGTIITPENIDSINLIKQGDYSYLSVVLKEYTDCNYDENGKPSAQVKTIAIHCNSWGWIKSKAL